MRSPSPALVIDTNIVLSMALSGHARHRDLFERVLMEHSVLLSERGFEEAEKVAATFKATRPGIDHFVRFLLKPVQVVNAMDYASRMGEAAECLRLAVPSRNGSTTDAHILALAWLTGSDIWSGDRDFAGTGWPSWSSANLARALDLQATP